MGSPLPVSEGTMITWVLILSVIIENFSNYFGWINFMRHTIQPMFELRVGNNDNRYNHI